MDPNYPLHAPPPGVIPDFVHPESLASSAITCVTICLSFMMVAIVARLYSKILISHSLWWDDYVCIVAAMGAIAYAGVILSLLKHGIGTHIWNITLGKIGEGGFKTILLFETFYGPIVFCVKLSIFLLYLRIFAPNRKFRIYTYLGILWIFLLHAITTSLYAVFCAPRGQENWLTSYMSTRCRHDQKLALAASVFNLISDLYIICLPIPAVWKLQLPRKKKVGVLVVFMTGSLACISTLITMIMRIIYLHADDITWTQMYIVELSFIEITLGIICTCMPACTILFRQSLPRLFSLNSLRSRLFSKTGGSSSKQYAISDGDCQPNSLERDRVHLKQASDMELGYQKDGRTPSYPRDNCSDWREGW